MLMTEQVGLEKLESLLGIYVKQNYPFITSISLSSHDDKGPLLTLTYPKSHRMSENDKDDMIDEIWMFGHKFLGVNLGIKRDLI